MIARAPGKLVLSGAYAVLEGAPCLVAAVDRYAVADSARPVEHLADEVRTAIEMGIIERAPWIDASALREPAPDGTSRKLGLGSSAAILAASLAAALGDRYPDEKALREAIFPMALAAHRKAQGGGSGVDVAASTFGGVLLARLDDRGDLSVAPHAIPEGVVIEVFASPVSAVTRTLIAAVRAFADRDPARHRVCMEAAHLHAREAVDAETSFEVVYAVSRFAGALQALGEGAGVPIVTPEVAALRKLADAEVAAFCPSGAGGGDIAIFVGREASSEAFRAEAARLGHTRLDLAVGADGASLVR